MFPKYTPGETVELTEGHKYFWATWAQDNGYTPGQMRTFHKAVRGKFIKSSPDSGPMYKIIEIAGEQFEIMHTEIKKVLDKPA